MQFRSTALQAIALLALTLAGCAPQPNNGSGSTAESASAASDKQSGTVPARVSQVATDANGPQLSAHVPGELLVKFRDATGAMSASSSKHGLVLNSKRVFHSVRGLQLVKLAPGVSVAEALTSLRSQGDVEYAEPNYIYRKQAVPNDPSLGQQWGLDNAGQSQGLADADIDAREAWDVTTGSASVVVAVIDTGVDYTHPDLAPNMFRNEADCDANLVDDDANGYVDDCHGIDVVDGDSDPMDEDGHGTHVAGIIAARGNNGIGVTGVAWNSSVIACRFIDAQGGGNAADAISCLDYVAAMRDRGVNVVATNNSWGDGVASRALQDAIDRQRQRGILFVAAAGNAPSIGAEHNLGIGEYLFESGSVYPCAYPLPNVICVAASTRTDDLEPYSYYGLHVPHVFAPGDEIYSALPGGAYGAKSGTSMATPHVTGIIALLKSALPGMGWFEARNRVIAGGDYITRHPSYPDLGWPVISRKRVNALGALTCANAEVLRRVAPRSSYPEDHYAIGKSIPISVMHTGCIGAAGAVSATVNPGNVTIPLLDDGQGADGYAGDGVYSATWTPQAAGAYTLTFPGLLVRDAGAGIGPDEFTINVDPYLENGFPTRMLQSPGLNRSQPQSFVANLDGGADLEIVASPLMNGPTYAWKSNGTLLAGWPLERAGRRYYVGYFAAGNLDADPATQEIIGTVADDGTSNNHDPILGDPLEAYSGSGQILPCWPRATHNFMQMQPVTADIDRDGIDEAFFGGNDGYLRGITHDCQQVPGAFLDLTLFTGGQTVPTPIAGDLDADGLPELVLNGGIYQPGQPNQLGIISFATGSAVMRETAQPAFTGLVGIGDVDGDGEMNIIGTSSEIVSGSTVEVIRVMAPGGATVRTFQFAPPGLSSNRAVLADLDGDGIPEIVISLTQFDSFYQLMRFDLTALRGNGTTMPGFPMTLKSGAPTITHVPTISPLAVGDVDGDLRPEIVANADGDLYAVNHDGSMAFGTPHTLPNHFRFNTVIPDQPLIADIDADGRNEIVLLSTSWSGVQGYNNVLYAYDLRGPASHGPIEWGQAREGSQRRGFYETGKNLVNDAYVAIRTHGEGRVTSTSPAFLCEDHCLHRYAKNSVVRITATPTSGGTFSSWRGACAGQGATCQLTVSKYTATTAVFSAKTLQVSIEGPGAVTSDIGGIECPTTCSAEYQSSQTVTLTASPVGNATFIGWSGASSCQPANPICALPMSVSRSVTASFHYRVPLNVVISSGEGTGVVNYQGFTCNIPYCSQYIDYGTQLTLHAVPAGDRSVSWTHYCGTNPVCVLDMTTGYTLVVSFPARVQITAERGGTGAGVVTSEPAGIDCGTSCTARFDSQTTFGFTATPNADSVFVGWTGACAGFTANNCFVTANGNLTFGATFALKLPLQVTRTGSGTVTSNVAGIDCGTDCTELYAPGTIVRLTATAAAQQSFEAWSGTCTGNAPDCTVTMDQARAVTARFAPWPTLTVTRGGTGTGSVSSAPAGIDCGADCSESYNPSTSVTLTATVAAGSSFTGWSGACSGSGATCSVNVAAASAVTASFAASTPPPPPPTSSGGKGGGRLDLSLLALSLALVIWRASARARGVGVARGRARRIG